MNHRKSQILSKFSDNFFPKRRFRDNKNRDKDQIITIIFVSVHKHSNRLKQEPAFYFHSSIRTR